MPPADRPKRQKPDEYCCAPGEKMDALARLSDRLSHKVNNMLTSVLNYNFILKSSAQDKKALAMHGKIEEGVQRANEILQNIVDASQRASGQYVEADLPGLIKSGIDTVLKETGTGADIRTDFQGREKAVLDKESFGSVFCNLLRNAVESGAGLIIVNCHCGPDRVNVSVTDDGPGISRENLHSVFEPMFTTKNGRPGLGLYASCHLLKSMGGNICLSLKEPGRTIFSFEIPARQD